MNEGHSLNGTKTVLGHADIRSTQRHRKYQTEKLKLSGIQPREKVEKTIKNLSQNLSKNHVVARRSEAPCSALYSFDICFLLDYNLNVPLK